MELIVSYLAVLVIGKLAQEEYNNKGVKTSYIDKYIDKYDVE